jgi:hypothetical protein
VLLLRTLQQSFLVCCVNPDTSARPLGARLRRHVCDFEMNCRKNFPLYTSNTMSKRSRSDDTPSSKRQKLPKGYHMMPDGTVMRDSDHDLSEDLASTADMLVARPDLWRSDPLPRAEPLVSDPTTVPRKGLSRLGRAEAAARPRRTAAQTPDAPRRRGENRAASVFNRAPGWAPALVVPQGAPVIDLT